MSEMQFFYGNQTGAPSLGTLGAGDMVAVLDAALVNGFATQSASITVTSAVATVTVTGHNWRVGQMVTVSGVSGGPTGFANLNQTGRILSVATNTFTMAAAGVSNGSATGTPLAKLAACGVQAGSSNPWGIAFTASNQRAYRAATGLRHYLMVTDSADTNTARVRGFTAMSAVTTGTGPFPTTAQSDTNLRWARPNPTDYASTSAPNDSWVLVGDDKRFFLGVCFSSSGFRDWYGFGEFQSYKPADAYNSFLFGFCNADGSDSLSSPSPAPAVGSPTISGQGTDTYYTSALVVARAHGQVTQSFNCGLRSGFSNSTVVDTIGGTVAAGTSSPISGGIELSLLEIIENTSGSLFHRRGRLPILLPWTLPDFENNDGTVYSGITNFGSVLAVRGQYSAPSYGLIFPVGDWDTVLS